PAGIYNPLYIYGDTGLGKTHLLHAIIDEAQRRHPHLCVRFYNAEALLALLANKEAMAAAAAIEQPAIFLIDDLQRLAGAADCQQALIALFDEWHGRSRQMVFASRLAPRHLHGFDTGLISRLQWGLVVEIENLNYAARLQFIRHKCEMLGLTLSAEACAFLAERLAGGVREIEGIMLRLQSHGALLAETLDLALIRAALREYLVQPERRISLAQVAQAVCEQFQIPAEALISKNRIRSISHPRQIAMFLGHTTCGASLDEIGRYFGGRDHTTVKYALERIKFLSEQDATVRETIAQLRRRLASGL
ncbi:MAG: DnaA/Hda family protein, partial [Planctomycetota bacterium]|nr:DnaA/Hda family protein [Planctomycetota bacterium]